MHQVHTLTQAARWAGRVVVPWLCPGQPSQPLCHDTNCCIVTQCMLKMGSSPATACNVFFFLSFQLLEKHQIYIYIYIGVFPINQINLLKFILFIFLSVLHTINLRKISSHQFFFPSPVASLLLHKYSSLDHCTSYNSKKNL